VGPTHASCTHGNLNNRPSDPASHVPTVQPCPALGLRCSLITVILRLRDWALSRNSALQAER